jgi:hypothetical protein
MIRQPVIEVIDDISAIVIRRLTPAERLERANRMVVDARRMIESALRAEHPDWPAERVASAVRRRMAGDVA